MTVLFNAVFAMTVEAVMSQKNFCDDASPEEKFKRYEKLFECDEFGSFEINNRWGDARSIFLAAKARNLGVGHELL